MLCYCCIDCFPFIIECGCPSDNSVVVKKRKWVELFSNQGSVDALVSLGCDGDDGIFRVGADAELAAPEA